MVLEVRRIRCIFYNQVIFNKMCLFVLNDCKELLV